MKQFEREEKNRFDFLQLKPIRNPVEHIRIAFDVIELGDFRGGVTEEVGYLFGGEGFDVAVFVLDSVDQSGCKGMAEAVETFGFYAGGGEDSVESFAEVDGSGDFAVLIGDEWTILAEVEFFAEVFDHLYCSIVKRDVSLARCALEFADDHLSPTLFGDAFALGNLFHTALNVHDAVI